MRRLVPLLALGVLLGGCSTRERANPFDPQNPNTRGRPAGFVALAANAHVNLRWLRTDAPDLIGYQLFRRGPFETQFAAITGTMGTAITAFTDPAVTNGYDYSYRLYFVFDNGLGPLPAEDLATPGPVKPWVIESGGTDAIEVTADARHIARRDGGFESTNDIAVNPTDGLAWVSDFGRGQVVVLNSVSGVRTTIPVTSPAAIAVDPYDGTGWVCDLSSPVNAVRHFRPQGDPATFEISGVLEPIDVAVDAEDGSVWVCERGGNRVSRFDASATRIWSCPSAAPSRVAIDSTTREGWVTSYTRGTVTHIGLGGAALDTLTGFAAPFGIVADARRGRIWVADPGAGQVIALDRSGSEVLRVPGLADAGELALDVRTGDVWVVCRIPGELVRVSTTGVVRRRLAGFNDPTAVAVDPNGH